MRINLTSVYVDDQRAALAFYTDVLGFTKNRDVPLGDDSWLTVISPENPRGPELLLEPAGHPAVKPYRDALVEDGIPLAQFAVDDVGAEYARLTGKGVGFTNRPRTSALPSSPSSTTPVETSSSSSPRSRTPTSASESPRVRWSGSTVPV
jgi:catechol 2,3-dioxygenase-like lactoylglutathione lyase family enzyme